MTRRRAHGSAVSVEVFSMPRKILRRLGRASRLLLTSGLLLALSPAAGASSQGLTGDIWAHDPSLIQWNGCYYAFSTGHPPLNEGTITIRRACGDLSGPWELIGTVFDAQPEWIAREIGAKPRHLWAPDISYHNGKFYLYYAGSTFGSNVSVIGLATNTTLDPQDPDYQWIDEGMVIRSYRHNNYNAIDPEVFWGEGEAWLLFGSWWDGIKMRRLDPATGKPSNQDTTLYSLASRQGAGIEAPALLYRDGYYYLFVSFDRCCAGRDSTYNIRVGRAQAITGPYYDRDGVPMLQGGGTLLMGRGDFPAVDGGTVHVRGAGGQDVFLDGDSWKMVYHWYMDSGAHRMSISDLSWTDDGWPVMGPIQ